MGALCQSMDPHYSERLRARLQDPDAAVRLQALSPSLSSVCLSVCLSVCCCPSVSRSLSVVAVSVVSVCVCVCVSVWLSVSASLSRARVLSDAGDWLQAVRTVARMGAWGGNDALAAGVLECASSDAHTSVQRAAADELVRALSGQHATSARVVLKRVLQQQQRAMQLPPLVMMMLDE
jgi:hypothetical protein